MDAKISINKHTKGSDTLIQLEEYKQQIAAAVQALKEAGDSL